MGGMTAMHRGGEVAKRLARARWLWVRRRGDAKWHLPWVPKAGPMFQHTYCWRTIEPEMWEMEAGRMPGEAICRNCAQNWQSVQDGITTPLDGRELPRSHGYFRVRNYRDTALGALALIDAGERVGAREWWRR